MAICLTNIWNLESTIPGPTSLVSHRDLGPISKRTEVDLILKGGIVVVSHSAKVISLEDSNGAISPLNRVEKSWLASLGGLSSTKAAALKLGKVWPPISAETHFVELKVICDPDASAVSFPHVCWVNPQ